MFVTHVPVFVLCAKNILKLFYVDSCLYYLLDINKLEFLWYYYIVVLLRKHGKIGFVYNFFKFHLFVAMWSLTLNNRYNKIDTNWTWLFFMNTYILCTILTACLCFILMIKCLYYMKFFYKHILSTVYFYFDKIFFNCSFETIHPTLI